MQSDKCTTKLRSGLFGVLLEEFINDYKTIGYSDLTLEGYIGSISHFEWWLNQKGVSIETINEQVLVLFENHRCTCPHTNNNHSRVTQSVFRRVKRFVDYLQKREIIKTIASVVDEIPYPEVSNFREWLLQSRGLSMKTIERYERLINRLLPKLGFDTSKYTAQMIREIVIKEVNECSRAQAKTIVTAFRSYLRFLASEGRSSPFLMNAVPTIPEWRLSSMPRYLDEDEIKRVIDACDLNTKQGIRDRAILLLLSRLGLRAGDVFSLRLEDLDWSMGIIRVYGKSRSEVLLPLPQDVGDAILLYLEKARPLVTIDKVFLCLNAPYRSLGTSSLVSCIVSSALRRAGIENPPSRGAHLLRHSAATMMLRSGSSLETISAILRHRSVDMTGYYAKVDFNMLRKIAQPWPGERQ
ncbi:tyrosine-type recombinase/integrase [candidate division CSSED10-310 bacterium]|uniref:Tyrosine-type recombinase/integrase n=1 Tax=candidate division CSSED10-310 bacterium TaxID=2855610 RepID=A0ABV6YRA5_UNCC1